MKFFILSLLLVSCVTTPPPEQAYKFTKADVEAAQKLNEILPYQMQPGVYLSNVELLESGTLKNTLLIKDRQLIRYFRKFGVKEIVDKKFVCSDLEMKAFLLKGGILMYEVTSAKENFGTVSMTKKSCSNLKGK